MRVLFLLAAALVGAAAQASTCPTTATAYTGADAATACGGCDAAGLIALEACKDDAATTATCGAAIIAGTGTTTISPACTACVTTAASAAGMAYDASNLNSAIIVRELAPYRQRPR